MRYDVTSTLGLRLEYARADGERTERVVRPLGAFFWGRQWTLTAWCEQRGIAYQGVPVGTIKCHVTGYGQPGGWVSFADTPG